MRRTESEQSAARSEHASTYYFDSSIPSSKRVLVGRYGDPHRRNEITLCRSWQPIEHHPRRLWVACIGCGYSAINEDRQLRGWQETATTPRRYRCAECSEAAA